MKKKKKQNKKEKYINKIKSQLINKLKEFNFFQICFKTKQYYNSKQINYFYLKLSTKFEILVQFAKANPKLNALWSPIQLDLFKYRRKNIKQLINFFIQLKGKNKETI
ncbi:hypothetical protein TTHERM_000024479 (macronuclear) [Tetrahymena thermophila SB210]|uniref:Uncharacterized protein n=1 Tax=Tetrahymena thermophila (strain SB210) TaxID=312017 RepID=W7XKC3_TETTS|nr:hypothetical protein TTHERM_000024479 [Tetrahymena thermophila SB210]EWS76401.1 hypothetical protein TTHERM_000024479 [Tetrahymena thermophila SB210]|eukprot:XP_012651185.1 hypothetical protein TTHERM_000024479 [Tetrahymena thermophila SB210]